MKTTTGVTFNDGVPAASLYLFEDTDILQKGRNNEAVINLFVDAHWAMAFDVRAEYGLFQRKKYNVSTGISTDYQLTTPRTLNYVVYFNSEEALNGFTLDSLDPFIITQYSGGRWETHLDEFRDAKTLFDYVFPLTVKDLPWALMVPYASFRYPLEGVNIGFYRNGALFGAYMNIGCSFGEWARDRMKCIDWYTSPTFNQVF